MRTRSRYKLLNTNRTVSTFLSGGPSFAPFFTNTVLAKEFELMTDTTTPGYKQSKGMILPQNPLSYACSTLAEAQSSMYWSDRSNGRRRLVSGCVTQYLFTPTGLASQENSNGQGFTKILVPTPSGYSLNNMIASVKAKALVRFSTPEYSFREPIAQVVQTLYTIHHPLQALRRIASRFSKAKASKLGSLGKKDARALADLWLNYSVNAGPNVQTINDAMNAYAKRHNKRLELQNSFALEKYNSGLLLASQVQSPTLSGTVRAERNIEAVVKAGVLYSIAESDDDTTILGLKERHFPGLVWELIPLSFVVDRMVNVKHVLDSASALISSKMRVKGAYVVTRVTDRYKRRVTGLTISGSVPPSPADTPPLYETLFSMDRSRWDPTFFDVLPPISVEGVVKRLHSTLDVVSLIISKLTK